MRFLILAAALLAAACSVETQSGSNTATPHGYRLEIRADKENKIFLVTAPDGRATGGMVSRGQSSLLTAHAMELLARVPPPTSGSAEGDQHVSFHAPGFSMDVSGDGKDDETTTGAHASADANANADANGNGTDHGQAHLSFNFGGHSMQVDAQGDENEHGNAHVVINGADEDTARDFIKDGDDLSPAVKQQMLQAVGL